MKYVILHENGTYYQKMAKLGSEMVPMFGADKEDAAKFKTEFDAGFEVAKHYGFRDAKIVKLDE